MARVFGIHVVELCPGVTAEEFERFVLETFLPALPVSQTPGVDIHLLKGDRGERAGKYIFMFEFDSIEARNRYFPAPGRPSEELKRLIEPLRPLSKKWEALSARAKTDYVVLGSMPLE
ncbi:MAG: hypothetical protein M5U01_14885 [Ardenticatenaceae bacterium]|nr:hypothetical protein [Ardenticatenaceae bacterium]HBY92930.1 hypothetical protein [Chloroflexota bacterium]